MGRVRPRSPSANDDTASCRVPQPPGPSAAKRPRVQEPERPEPLAQPDLEAPGQHASEELLSVMVVADGCNVQLHLDSFDLLLEPEPNSVLQMSRQGRTMMLVPEGLQASNHLGQPGFLPARPQGAALMGMPQDHLFLIQPGSFSASGSHRECLENASNPHEDPQGGSLMPWLNAPAGLVPGLLLSYSGASSFLFPGQAAEPWHPSASASAERYASPSNWSLNSSMLAPLPSSPLQPLPESPPDPQAQPLQTPQRPSCPPCKARRRLF
ncbi:proline-rich protein 23A3-like [Acomys russatus]|uniref:proline-rich protein 23A3-like n=1 Tax=Acomys russatus TaxID=60746 RepID=UPI0021E29EBC|nr:proline-rich protein 23A3-like [Acomys russatus]